MSSCVILRQVKYKKNCKEHVYISSNQVDIR